MTAFTPPPAAAELIRVGRRLGVTYLGGQTCLEPHPRELMLRNHV